MARILKVTWLERKYIFSISRTLVFMLVLVVAACYFVQTFAVSAIEGYAKNIDKNSNIATLELNAYRPDAKILDEKAVAAVRQLKHVVAVSPWFQHDLVLQDNKDWPVKNQNPGSLWATTYFQPRLPKMVKGPRPQQLDKGQIILPATISGVKLTYLYGKKIRFGYTHADGQYQGSLRTIDLKVVGLYDNSVPGQDGKQASYVSMSTMKQLYGGTTPSTFMFIYVQVDSAQNRAGVQQELADLGFSVSGTAGAQNMVGLVGTLVRIDDYVLPAILVCTLIFGVFLSLIWIKQRKQDFALFRCLGYTPKDLACLISLQVLSVNIMSSIIGTLLGAAAVYVLADVVMSGGSAIYGAIHVAACNWTVAAQVIGVSAVGALVGSLPFVVYITRVSPDRLLRS